MAVLQSIEADLLIAGAELITMNPAREVIRDGALGGLCQTNCTAW
jgi:hypothetical protein